MKNLVSFYSLIYYACKILLLISLFNWWMGHADAADIKKTSVDSLDGLETHRMMNRLGNSVFRFKETIECPAKFNDTDRFIDGRELVTYRRCADLTVSFDQPASSGAAGWNGYCGQTAITNTVALLCARFLNPTFVDTYARDLTPGNRPDTSIKALRKIFTEAHPISRSRTNLCPAGQWLSANPRTAQDYLRGLRESLWEGQGRVERKRADNSVIQITPVMVLIAAGIRNLHWVVLVDFLQNSADKYGCDAVMNTWGAQRIMTCENLVSHGLTPIFGYRYLQFQ
jgi:hypothetical protein